LRVLRASVHASRCSPHRVPQLPFTYQERVPSPHHPSAADSRLAAAERDSAASRTAQ
jgi:hypothetical protein